MASRPNPRPSNSNRRRPGPYLPGSLILMLVAVALVVAIFLNPLNAARTIKYSDYLKLVEKRKLEKVTFVGKERLVGVVKNPQDPEIKDLQLSNGRFSVSLPQSNDRKADIDVILKYDPSVEIDSEEDHGAWVGPLLTTLLTTMLL